jgi:Fe-S-cluster containining protein
MKKNQQIATAHIELSVGGKPKVMEMNFPAEPVKIKKMLPVFQKASDYFVKLGIEKSKSGDKEISCRTNCAACCRQAIPISEAEAHFLRDLVESMPEPDRSIIKKRFADALNHLEKTGWLKKVFETPLIRDKKMRKERRNELAGEYFSEGISCPFLKNESCSIYKNRPLICREYLVVSPAENCADTFKNGDKIEPVETGLEASRALFKMAVHKGAGQKTNFVPLIALFKWTDEFSENKKIKPGGKWIREFFSFLA